MKAWYLTTTAEEEAAIVFAETASKAKSFIYSCGIYYDNYTDIRVRRDKRYDGLEKLSAAQLALRQWRNGWRWFDCQYPDVDTATDTEFLEWYNTNFNNSEDKIYGKTTNA